jgi:hypothetical protein
MQFPADMMDALRKMAMEVLEEEAAKDPMSKKVHEAIKKFKKQVGVWGTVADKAYFDVIAEKYTLESWLFTNDQTDKPERKGDSEYGIPHFND